MFFENLLLETNHALKNRYLHIDFQSATINSPKCQNGTLDYTFYNNLPQPPSLLNNNASPPFRQGVGVRYHPQDGYIHSCFFVRKISLSVRKHNYT